MVLNLPLVGIFTALLRILREALVTLIVIASVIGVFSVNNSVLDLWVMLGMGILGYVLRKFRFNPATLVLPFVIGTLTKQSFVQTLVLARGDPAYLLTRPIALGLLLAGVVAPVLPPHFGRVRRMFAEH